MNIHPAFFAIAQIACFMVTTVAFSAQRRVLIVGIDGGVGSLVQKRALVDGKAPNLKRLMESGVYAPCPSAKDASCARAHQMGPTLGAVWKTAPGWASVVTGLDSAHHGVWSNEHKDLQKFQAQPNLFQIALNNGLTTAAGGVAAFLTSNDGSSIVQGVVDYGCGYDNDGALVKPDAESTCQLTQRKALHSDDPNRDAALAGWLERMIRDTKTDLIMGVFDQVDATGHADGFSDNRDYMGAITKLDSLLTPLLRAIDDRLDTEEWLVIVTADHGGHKTWLGYGIHGDKQFDDSAVPFIVNLRSKGNTPLSPLHFPVKQMDTMPTALSWLKIPVPPSLDGRVQGIAK